MKGYLVTAESVTEGHPDKICDQISDGILDEYLRHDVGARVAVETLISKNTVVIAGEITSKVTLDVATIARKILQEIGYTQDVAGIDGQKCLILTNINCQSPDIALGVDKQDHQLGAGDQGIIYGYASDETENLMPLPIELAHQITKQLAQVRKNGSVWWLYPDGKSQVTVKYNEQGEPLSVDSIILSAQHRENIEYDYLYDILMVDVLYASIGQYMTNQTRIHINPTGRFVLGGPAADTGLTGRKMMVDTYGGVARHGGGAFSGKDATKVDRSAAYMARYVAKNIVGAKLAKRCEVSIAYAIGKEEPEAVTINTFQTEQIDLQVLHIIVEQVFSFKPHDIINQLDLRQPRFKKTAAYGHFGRPEEEFTWERLDKVEILRKVAEPFLFIQEYQIPVGISNRHIHLSQADFKVLFGSDAELISMKELKQPGQFAAKQTLTIKGPKGQFEKVRILGPFRSKSQIEVSLSDTFQLGVKASIRESGDLEQTQGIELIGPKGTLYLQKGVIIAARHIHMSKDDADKLGLKDKDKVSVETFGERESILGNILVRVSEQFVTEIHLDLDEANACALKNQDFVRIYNL